MADFDDLQFEDALLLLCERTTFVTEGQKLAVQNAIVKHFAAGGTSPTDDTATATPVVKDADGHTIQSDGSQTLILPAANG